MKVARRITLFALVLAAAFGVAALAGAAIDPTDDRPAAADHGGDGAAADGHGAAGDHAGAAAEQAGGHGSAGAGGHGAAAEHGGGAAGGHGGATLGGLAVAEDGLTLALDDPVRAPGRAPLRFRILGPDGAPVTGGYDVEHTKRLHLIVVRRDTARFRHLHPRLRADGTWETTADLPQAGDYRVFADFRLDGAKHALAADLSVPGRYDARRWPAPRASAPTDTGGLDVALNRGDVHAGHETTLRFAVTRDGTPVEDLQPYLGAKGHLVALREGDLGYLHVHPLETAERANEIAFMATFPTPGRYRLFLQLRTDDRVRTVPFTLEVPR